MCLIVFTSFCYEFIFSFSNHLLLKYKLLDPSIPDKYILYLRANFMEHTRGGVIFLQMSMIYGV